MSLLRGRVQGGHIVIEEAVDLPEGAEVRLAVVEAADGEDQLDAEDRARLDAAIAKGRQEIAEGRGIPAEQVVAELWAAHRP
jgi:predicted transcriptional regulator